MTIQNSNIAMFDIMLIGDILDIGNILNDQLLK